MSNNSRMHRKIKSGIVVEVTCEHKFKRISAFTFLLRLAVFLKNVPGWGTVLLLIGIKVHFVEGKDE